MLSKADISGYKQELNANVSSQRYLRRKVHERFGNCYAELLRAQTEIFAYALAVVDNAITTAMKNKESQVNVRLPIRDCLSDQADNTEFVRMLADFYEDALSITFDKHNVLAVVKVYMHTLSKISITRPVLNAVIQHYKHLGVEGSVEDISNQQFVNFVMYLY